MSVWSYGKKISVQSVVVKSIIHIDWMYGNELDFELSVFFKSPKGQWIKKNSLSINKHITYDGNGDKMLNVTALFTESHYNFYILKWG